METLFSALLKDLYNFKKLMVEQKCFFLYLIIITFLGFGSFLFINQFFELQLQNIELQNIKTKIAKYQDSGLDKSIPAQENINLDPAQNLEKVKALTEDHRLVLINASLKQGQDKYQLSCRLAGEFRQFLSFLDGFSQLNSPYSISLIKVAKEQGKVSIDFDLNTNLNEEQT